MSSSIAACPMAWWQDNANVPEGNTVGMSLPNDATAPTEARHAVRATPTRWRLPALVDSCVLTVSELVTNAVRYGLPPLGLVMRRRKGAVRIDVSDASRSFERSRTT